MNNITMKSLISGLVTGMIWLMVFLMFFFVIVRLMASSGSGFDEKFFFRLYIMGGSIFAMGLACGAPVKYYELKKLENKDYKYRLPYLLSSFCCFCLILLMMNFVPTKKGISSLAAEPGGAIFMAVLFGALLPLFGALTVHNIDRKTRRKVE
jgi:hypothetical protein